MPTVPPRLLAAMGPWSGETVDAVVFASEDGETWVPSDGGYADSVGVPIGGRSLAHDPRIPPVVYLAASYQVMQSADGGKSWSSWIGVYGVVRIFWENRNDVWLANSFSRNLGDTVREGYVYHSIDAGRFLWSRAPESGVGFASPMDVLVTPDGRVWLAGAGVAVSKDRGNTWELSLNPRLGGELVGLITSILPAGDTLYVVSQQGAAGARLGVFRLRPGRSRWDAIVVPQGTASGLSATLDDEGRLLVGTAGTGVWRMEW